MRTSKLAQETARMFSTLTSSRLTRRSAQNAAQSGLIKSDPDEEKIPIDEATAASSSARSSRKRKQPLQQSERATKIVKKEEEIDEEEGSPESSNIVRTSSRSAHNGTTVKEEEEEKRVTLLRSPSRQRNAVSRLKREEEEEEATPPSVVRPPDNSNYMIKKEEDEKTVVVTRTSPRKHTANAMGIKEEPSDTETATDGFARKAKRQPAKQIRGPDGVIARVEPPGNWEEVYKVTQDMRKLILAPVDTMGCESLAEETRSPRDQRFQTLVSLMLSSQTKDTVTAVAMRNLQQNLPNGLTLESILAVEPTQLNECINKVGFHNNKTKFIKAAAEILQDKFGGDIPDTIEGMVSLPGVGPKMAYLCMSAAWGRDEGIGVDVHVHRITNLWGWHKTSTPEQTREMLESWLPRDKWHDINHLLVGFGQTWCPPVGRKCERCKLAEKGLCPSAVVARTTTARVKKEEAVVKIEGSTATSSLVDMKIEHAEVGQNDVGSTPSAHSALKLESDVKPKLEDIEDIGRPTRRTLRSQA